MIHTSIITPENLSDYADVIESQNVIPELINLLINQSVSKTTDCRIPYGNSINQPGMDGIVNCQNGFLQFIPEGISYWEIGTGKNPQDKANSDFNKRTKQLDDEKRSNSSFVFVTPRCAGANGWQEPKQSQWIDKRRDKGWKDIKIIDGVILADWIREFPAIGKWLAIKMGIISNFSSIMTPFEHWDLIYKSSFLPPELFIASRQEAYSAIEDIFSYNINKLFLFSESENDVEDFVAAFLMTIEKDKAKQYANRCLFIKDRDTWQTISQLRESHVLVANTRIGLDTQDQDLQTLAITKGHRIIIPLCGNLFNKTLDDGAKIIKLQSPQAYEIEDVLKKANFSDIRSKELAKIGDRRLSALRRHFIAGGVVPPYCKWSTARELSKACFIGQWDASNPSDIKAIEKFINKSYTEWMGKFRSDALRSDSPLTQINEKWRVVNRSEAWDALGCIITDEDIDRFKDMAIQVLSERDPELDLPKEERYAAAIYGKKLKYSTNLRNGISETLSLIGSRPKTLVNCSTNKAEFTVDYIVKTLLYEANWERWISLEPHLSLLAEASPNEFLEAVELALNDLTNSPFCKIFKEEGSGIEGHNYMSGLLWALEGLAWSCDYLSRVSIILGDLASIDPGGNWSNRPINSLINIFLPWHIQTTASFDQRKAVIKNIIKEQPNIGWSLLISLLPNKYSYTTGCNRPTWRDFIPSNWEGTTTNGEYIEQIIVLSSMAVDLAKNDIEKLIKLTRCLADLPKSAYDSILNNCSSDYILNLSEEERYLLWEELDEIVRKHRKFSDASWALHEEELRKIEDVANIIKPISPEIKFQYLFANKDFELLEEKGDYDKQIKNLSEKRKLAICEILKDKDFSKLMNFTKRTAEPFKVGLTLGEIECDLIENHMLPSFLDSSDSMENKLIEGYFKAKFYKYGIDWVDMIMKKDWNPEYRAKFLALLPFNEKVWGAVFDYLGEDYEAIYWKNTKINPYESKGDLTNAIKKLLHHKRAGAATMCVAHNALHNGCLDENLAICALTDVLNSEDNIKELRHYETVELIKRLQQSKTTNQDSLLTIEWNFLPWLHSLEISPMALEKKLACDPDFFMDIISYIFRSENDNNIKKEHNKYRAKNASNLLYKWNHCPGVREDGNLDVNELNAWINKVIDLAKQRGYKNIVLEQIGKILTFAPQDPSGLWIHKAAANILDRRDGEKIRLGFKVELFNQRGVHTFTWGKEEREIARKNQERAEALEKNGFSRFATAMRQLAEEYLRNAAAEEQRNIYD